MQVSVPPRQPQVREVFSALSNGDCYLIFKLASSGIDASTEVLGEYNLSKKRYYVRLRQLVKLGLIQKSTGKYILTDVGRSIYDIMRDLELRISEHPS